MMKTRLGPVLLAVLVLCSGCAWAQTDAGTPDTTAPTQPGPQPAFTYPDTTPSLDFLNGAVENSSLTLGVSTGVFYLNYGTNSSSSSQNRWLYQVMPSISIQQFRPRLSWSAGYSGGLQIYTTPGSSSGGNSDYFSQTAHGQFLWQMAKHWQMQGSERFTHSANPFDSYLTVAGTPTQNNPNPLTFYPLTSYTQNTAFLTLSNQLTKVDTLTFTGTANYRSTSNYNLLTSVPFYNLVSYGGQASYAHQFSPRFSLGAGYNFNSLDFGHGQQRSGVQTIQMTVDYLIRPNMSVSGYIGPEYTSTKTVVLGVPIYSSLWSPSLGINFGWQGLRNSFRAGYSRQVTDGAGIIATAQVDAVTASYRRLLTAKMDFQLGMRYSHVASVLTASRSYDLTSFNASLDYKLTKSLKAIARYSYFNLNQSSAFLIGRNNDNDNLVGVSIDYTWNHPLGR